MPKQKSERPSSRASSGSNSNRAPTPSKSVDMNDDIASNLAGNNGTSIDDDSESSKLLTQNENRNGKSVVNNVSSANNGTNWHNYGRPSGAVRVLPAGNGHLSHAKEVDRIKDSELPRSTPMMISARNTNLNNGKENSAVVISNGADLNKVSNQQQFKRLNRLGQSRRIGMVNKSYCGSYKVIAFICGLFACILLIMGLASSEWLISSGYRQGLFVYCVGRVPGANGTMISPNPTDIPFLSPTDREGDRSKEGCHRLDLNYQLYTLIAAAFCVVSLLVNVFATLLTVLGLRCRDPNHKYKYYRIAVYVMAVALVAVLVALVVYPICFAKIMPESKRQYWEFGWAYGVGWGASIFLFGGVILLLCDKESEEIYYKERTIVQYADSNNKV